MGDPPSPSQSLKLLHKRTLVKKSEFVRDFNLKKKLKCVATLQ